MENFNKNILFEIKEIKEFIPWKWKIKVLSNLISYLDILKCCMHFLWMITLKEKKNKICGVITVAWESSSFKYQFYTYFSLKIIVGRMKEFGYLVCIF